MLRCNDANLDPELAHLLRPYNESTTQEEFVTAAFKDLSVLKNPAAMTLFAKIRDRVVFPDDMFVWVRTAKRRPDGSAVVILHVSDYDKFVQIMENCNMGHTGAVGARALEDCVVIGA